MSKNTIDVVWVYGTLKRNEGNYGSMQRAEGEFVEEDYIQIDKVDNCGFPMVKLSEDSKRWLLVELFRVPIRGIEWPLDSLEWYTPNSPYNHYNRVKVKTFKGKEVRVYEIADDVIDKSENYYTHNEGDNLFFNWIG